MKKMYAVLDNYHEGRFPVIATCKTEQRAEEYIKTKIKADRARGNNYDYNIAEIEVDEEAENDSDRKL